MSRPETASLAAAIVERALANGLRVTTAESCTGGLVASAITDIAGSSAVFGTGFVTYSNEAKARWLGVPFELLQQYGAVSREVAEAMAKGAGPAGMADLSVAVTGIAGPGGGSDVKPVGLVHFATWSRLGVTHLERRFGDIGRADVRSASTLTALELLSETLNLLIADEMGDQTGTEFE